MLPQPLSVPCASPKVAFKLWPLQVALVLDITLQPFMLAFGAPLLVMPAAPLLASARRQNVDNVLHRFGRFAHLNDPGSIGRQGANAEYHRVDERIVGRKPRSLDFPAAAALPLTSITAWEAMFDRLDVARPVSHNVHESLGRGRLHPPALGDEPVVKSQPGRLDRQPDEETSAQLACDLTRNSGAERVSGENDLLGRGERSDESARMKEILRLAEDGERLVCKGKDGANAFGQGRPSPRVRRRCSPRAAIRLRDGCRRRCRASSRRLSRPIWRLAIRAARRFRCGSILSIWARGACRPRLDEGRGDAERGAGGAPRQRRLRAASTYIPRPVDTALWEQALRGRDRGFEGFFSARGIGGIAA